MYQETLDLACGLLKSSAQAFGWLWTCQRSKHDLPFRLRTLLLRPERYFCPALTGELSCIVKVHVETWTHGLYEAILPSSFASWSFYWVKMVSWLRHLHCLRTCCTNSSIDRTPFTWTSHAGQKHFERTLIGQPRPVDSPQLSMLSFFRQTHMDRTEMFCVLRLGLALSHARIIYRWDLRSGRRQQFLSLPFVPSIWFCSSRRSLFSCPHRLSHMHLMNQKNFQLLSHE